MVILRISTAKYRLIKGNYDIRPLTPPMQQFPKSSLTQAPELLWFGHTSFQVRNKYANASSNSKRVMCEPLLEGAFNVVVVR
jgi:hypothetical protein